MGRRWIIRYALLGTVVWGLFYARWTLLDRRFTTISEGRVYQSGLIEPGRLLEKVEEHGIVTVVALCTEDDVGKEALDRERDALTRAGVRYVYLPTKQEATPDTINAFLEIAGDPANQPLLVHCEHGEGRSVLLAAIYRIEYEGWDNERARRATRLFPFLGTFGPDGEKGKSLRDYVPRRR